MDFNAVIFDMDGLLIDSEPLWQEAGAEVLKEFGISLSEEQYHSSTGLRTPEWIDHWFSYHQIDKSFAAVAIKTIEAAAIEKIGKRGMPMPGVEYITQFFLKRAMKIGIASSSPVRLIEAVIEKLGIGNLVSAYTSAESLTFGKPHPQVFLDCAAALRIAPVGCLCFEDSFNGMIAAKSAKMKCVVIPAPLQHDETRWDAADLKLPSLVHFNDQHLTMLTKK